MTTALNWPTGLPNMMLDTHTLKPQPSIIRTDMDQGAARQRRRFTSVPTDVPFSLVLTAPQMQQLETWIDEDAHYGAAWFNVALRAPVGLINHEARLRGELEYKLLARQNWKVTGTLEVRDRPMVNDPDVVGWEDAVIANGGTVSFARRALMHSFVTSEKAAGVWALTDDYWMLWGENAIQARTSLKQRRLATVTGATHVPDRHYSFNGTSDFLNTGYIPDTHKVALAGGHARLAVYERTNLTTGYSIGAQNGSTSSLRLSARLGTTSAQGRVSSSTDASFVLTPQDSRGFTSISRANDGTSALSYKNGVALAPFTVAIGTGLPTVPIMLGAVNVDGVAGSFRAASLGMACIGAPMSAPRAAAQYTNVQALAAALGAQV